MIYHLEIENFHSVREPEVVDLTVRRRVPDEPGRLVPIHDGSDKRAPRVVAMFGPNASGKDNLLRAIAFLAWFIRDGFGRPDGESLSYDKFETAASNAQRTRLSMRFAWREDPLASGASPTCPYIYTLETGPRSGDGDEVTGESLHYRPGGATRAVRIFERDAEGRVRAASWLAPRQVIRVLERVLRPNAGVIPTLVQLNNDFAARLADAAGTVATNLPVDGIGLDDRGLQALYARNPKLVKALNRDIRRMDFGIERVRILATMRGGHVVGFRHAGLDGELGLESECRGVWALMRLVPVLHRALETGGVAAVSHLDAGLHPSLLPEILRWFRDPYRNPHGAQLWMSCHATSLLDELLREEVLIFEKSRRDGATEFYGLRDILGVRRDEDFHRYYMGGVYGGIPKIG